VPNLAEVVELGSITDHGFAYYCAVHAGSGTQFNTVPNAHAAEVRNFGPSSFACVRRDKSKSIGTQYDIGVQDAVGPDDGSGIQYDARVEYTARPNDDIYSEPNTGSKNRAWVNAGGAV